MILRKFKVSITPIKHVKGSILHSANSTAKLFISI